ncbi:MAG: Fur family transcriptional regulator [Trueperaceae bacterium]
MEHCAQPDHHEHARDLREVLKQYGLRYSRPREVILGFLLERDRHVSAESLYVDLKGRGDDLSLSTVYLNLSALADAGLVREFKGASGQSMYDSNVTPHYHVVCKETGEILDVPAPIVDGKPLGRFLKDQIEAATGWTVDEPRFSLSGVSPKAKAARERRDAELRADRTSATASSARATSTAATPTAAEPTDEGN